MSNNAENETIAREVGLALDQWSYVELNLERLFCLLLAVEHGPGHVAFQAVRHFQNRLKVVDDLIAYVSLPPSLKKEWRELKRKTSKKAEKRNQLAHFTIIHHTENGTKTTGLHPFYSTGKDLLDRTKNPQKLTDKGLSASDVARRGASFSEHAILLHQFVGKVSEAVRTKPK